MAQGLQPLYTFNNNPGSVPHTHMEVQDSMKLQVQ